MSSFAPDSHSQLRCNAPLFVSHPVLARQVSLSRPAPTPTRQPQATAFVFAVQLFSHSRVRGLSDHSDQGVPPSRSAAAAPILLPQPCRHAHGDLVLSASPFMSVALALVIVVSKFVSAAAFSSTTSLRSSPALCSLPIAAPSPVKVCMASPRMLPLTGLPHRRLCLPPAVPPVLRSVSHSASLPLWSHFFACPCLFCLFRRGLPVSAFCVFAFFRQLTCDIDFVRMFSLLSFSDLCSGGESAVSPTACNGLAAPSCFQAMASWLWLHRLGSAPIALLTSFSCALAAHCSVGNAGSSVSVSTSVHGCHRNAQSSSCLTSSSGSAHRPLSLGLWCGSASLLESSLALFSDLSVCRARCPLCSLRLHSCLRPPLASLELCGTLRSCCCHSSCKWDTAASRIRHTTTRCYSSL